MIVSETSSQFIHETIKNLIRRDNDSDENFSSINIAKITQKNFQNLHLISTDNINMKTQNQLKRSGRKVLNFLQSVAVLSLFWDNMTHQKKEITEKSARRSLVKKKCTV